MPHNIFFLHISLAEGVLRRESIVMILTQLNQNDSLLHFLGYCRFKYLKGSYYAISSFPFSLECYKLIVHRKYP